MDLDPRTRRTASTADSLARHSRTSPTRPDVEQFVRAAFVRHFDAHVTHFMPELLSLSDAAGAIRAAVGYRPAALEPLFLEAYTDGPIERLLATRLGVRIPRQSIVEIGGLACRGPRAALAIVRSLVPYLLDAGYSWTVFTGADTIRRVLGRLALTPLTLCAALPERLGAERLLWGRYYTHSPYVMAGPLRDGLAAVAALHGARL